MQLVDRIEKRRFVGREFLLWLWFESEVFDATLSTRDAGEFGLWIEKQIVLSAGKETTRIKGATPALGREAKEALLRGKLPESAGIHLSLREGECGFTLKAEPMALSGLTLPTVLGGEASEERDTTALLAPAKRPRRRKTSAAQDAEAESDESRESFYERMRLTRLVEEVLEGLYREFLVLRLGEAWSATVLPALRAWASGEEVDAEEYRAATKGRASRRRTAAVA
jgi:hypothetical protein